MNARIRDGNTRLLLVADGRGQVNQYLLERNNYRIGRDPANDICIPNKTVSARHAVLRWERDGYWLEDLGSRNGTYVRRERVQRHRLSHGDRVFLASAELIFVEHVIPKPDPERGLKDTNPDELMHTFNLSFDSVEVPKPVDKDHRPRQGETGMITPFRTGRFFNANGGWYFSTREGEEVGPFDSLEEAKSGLGAYLRKIGVRTGFDGAYDI